MNEEYRAKERRASTNLSEAQIEAIADRAADRAAEKALAKIYSEVGQGVVTKLAWLAGIVIISLVIWLAKAGKLYS